MDSEILELGINKSWQELFLWVLEIYCAFSAQFWTFGYRSIILHFKKYKFLDCAHCVRFLECVAVNVGKTPFVLVNEFI
jgi:hypothetical protein